MEGTQEMLPKDNFARDNFVIVFDKETQHRHVPCIACRSLRWNVTHLCPFWRFRVSQPLDTQFTNRIFNTSRQTIWSSLWSKHECLLRATAKCVTLNYLARMGTLSIVKPLQQQQFGKHMHVSNFDRRSRGRKNRRIVPILRADLSRSCISISFP